MFSTSKFSENRAPTQRFPTKILTQIGLMTDLG